MTMDAVVSGARARDVGVPGVDQRFVRITTDDGVSLAASVFHPAGDAPSAVLIVNSATGVRRQFYGRFAAYLATRNIAVVTYDYRGTGDSLDKSVAKYDATLLDWGRRDFVAVVRHTLESFPDVPVLGLGHSVGGQLFGLTPESRRLAGLIGVAAQSGYWQLSPTRARLWLTWHVVMPGLVAAFGYLPGWAGVGMHLPRGVALQWARWGRAREFFVDDAGTPLALSFSEITAPVLWYTIQHDPYGAAPAVEWIARHFTSAPIERRELRGDQFGTGPIGHFKIFTPRYRAAWDDMGDWIVSAARAVPRA